MENYFENQDNQDVMDNYQPDDKNETYFDSTEMSFQAANDTADYSDTSLGDEKEQENEIDYNLEDDDEPEGLELMDEASNELEMSEFSSSTIDHDAFLKDMDDDDDDDDEAPADEAEHSAFGGVDNKVNEMESFLDELEKGEEIEKVKTEETGVLTKEEKPEEEFSFTGDLEAFEKDMGQIDEENAKEDVENEEFSFTGDTDAFEKEMDHLDDEEVEEDVENEEFSFTGDTDAFEKELKEMDGGETIAEESKTKEEDEVLAHDKKEDEVLAQDKEEDEVLVHDKEEEKLEEVPEEEKQEEQESIFNFTDDAVEKEPDKEIVSETIENNESIVINSFDDISKETDVEFEVVDPITVNENIKENVVKENVVEEEKTDVPDDKVEETTTSENKAEFSVAVGTGVDTIEEKQNKINSAIDTSEEEEVKKIDTKKWITIAAAVVVVIILLIVFLPNNKVVDGNVNDTEEVTEDITEKTEPDNKEAVIEDANTNENIEENEVAKTNVADEVEKEEVVVDKAVEKWGLKRLSHIIGFGSFSTEETAKQVVNDLKKRGITSGYYWIPDYTGDDKVKLFKVYTGPYADKQEAEKKLPEIKKLSKDSYVLQP